MLSGAGGAAPFRFGVGLTSIKTALADVWPQREEQEAAAIRIQCALRVFRAGRRRGALETQASRWKEKVKKQMNSEISKSKHRKFRTMQHCNKWDSLSRSFLLQI